MTESIASLIPDTAHIPYQSTIAATQHNFDYDFKQLADVLDQLRSRLRIAVIHGGDKNDPQAIMYPTHNPRGTKNYQEVAEDIAAALHRLGFEHIDLLPEDMVLGQRLRELNIHFAWLNSGGIQGYNPVCHLPSVLEMIGVSYIGHNPLNASILDNKHAFKRELHIANIPTAPFVTWNYLRGPFIPEKNDRFRAAFNDYSGPFIVKPVSGRASLHVHYIEHMSQLDAAIGKIYHTTHDTVLIEPYLAGREFVISICGPIISRGRCLVNYQHPFIFSVSERLLDQDELIFTSMDVKPITEQRVRSLDSRTDATLLHKLQTIARQIYLDFNLETLIRIDVRADAQGQLYVLEANPKPDLKRPQGNQLSLACAGLAEQGMDYDDLIMSLLADRLNHLLLHRPATVRHIIDLLT